MTPVAGRQTRLAAAPEENVFLRALENDQPPENLVAVSLDAGPALDEKAGIYADLQEPASTPIAWGATMI